MFDELIEKRLRHFAAPLPPKLRDRVLDACAAKAALQNQRNRRANWRLAWGFAVVYAIHLLIGGHLDAQQRALLGTSASPTLYASNPTDMQANLVLRSQLLDELSDPRRRYF